MNGAKGIISASHNEGIAVADTPSPPSPEILEKLRQLREELAQKAAQQAPKDANTLAWQQSNAFKRIYPRANGGEVRRFDVGGSNSISIDELNEALRERAPTIPEQFNRYIAPHIQRGLDAMLPFRQLAQKTFERNVYNPLNESVINNIGAAIKTSGVNQSDVEDARTHMANAARRAAGMAPQPIPFDAQKALGDINAGEFDRQYVDMDIRHAKRLEEFKRQQAMGKANGGQVDMDRMRLELIKGKKVQHKWHGGPIVDSLVGTFPSLAPIANAIGATKVGLSEKELPTDDMYWYQNDATNQMMGNDRRGDVNPLLGIPRSTQPTDLPKSIKMYRADPTGKYGGKEGIETLPQPRFDVGGDRYHKRVEDPTISDVYGDSSKAIQQLYRYARLNGAANKYGYPSLSPEDVAAMALKEGRSDLGFNAVNLGHPDELKFNKMLRDTYNLTSNDQNFLAALFAKQRVADKFKIPFANAWNGTGVNDAGQSGKDYAKNYEHHRNAALHPNNQQLMELINRAIEDGKKYGLPLRENSIQDSMRKYIEVPYKKRGGRVTHAHHLDIEERPL